MVVDADLRKPTLHDLVGLKPGAGLVEVLRREVPLADALATDPRLPLKLLPGSKRLSQPTRLLGPDGIGALLTALRPSFDLILVDSAPLVAVVDAKLLAKLADAVLFVVRYGSTRRDFCDFGPARLARERGQRRRRRAEPGRPAAPRPLGSRRCRLRLRQARRVLRRLNGGYPCPGRGASLVRPHDRAHRPLRAQPHRPPAPGQRARGGGQLAVCPAAWRPARCCGSTTPTGSAPSRRSSRRFRRI